MTDPKKHDGSIDAVLPGEVNGRPHPDVLARRGKIQQQMRSLMQANAADPKEAAKIEQEMAQLQRQMMKTLTKSEVLRIVFNYMAEIQSVMDGKALALVHYEDVEPPSARDRSKDGMIAKDKHHWAVVRDIALKMAPFPEGSDAAEVTRLKAALREAHRYMVNKHGRERIEAALQHQPEKGEPT